MQLKWDKPNLFRHTAKHFLGRRSEAWNELLGTDEQRPYNQWAERQFESGCRTEKHGKNCPIPHTCSLVAESASTSYANLVDERWETATQLGLWTRELDYDQAKTYAIGAGAVFIVAIQSNRPNIYAMSAYRIPCKGEGRELAAVRELEKYRATSRTGLNDDDMIQLRTQLLGVDTGDHLTQQRAKALMQSHT